MAMLSFFILPALIGGAIYAVITAAVIRAIPKNSSRAKWISALCWLIILSAALWGWYTIEDTKAATTHSRNVGMFVVFFWVWITIILPAPVIGTVLLLLCARKTRTDTW